MRFTKMHGLGNDFILINGLEEKLAGLDWPFLARKLSDRHFGIGADQLLLLLPSEVADFRMRIFNSDGSEAEMCGNGIRCFAKFVYEHVLKKSELKVETIAGIIKPELILADDVVKAVKVDMGEPRLRRKEIPMTGEPESLVISEKLTAGREKFYITCLSMGNPHCVTFVEDVDSYRVWSYGPLLENHPVFPQRTNVEFVQILSHDEVKVRVWERGAGETLACGTGACASVVASVLNDKTERSVKVQLLGGYLFVQWHENNHVFMEGPAEEVFSGEIKL